MFDPSTCLSGAHHCSLSSLFQQIRNSMIVDGVPQIPCGELGFLQSQPLQLPFPPAAQRNIVVLNHQMGEGGKPGADLGWPSTPGRIMNIVSVGKAVDDLLDSTLLNAQLFSNRPISKSFFAELQHFHPQVLFVNSFLGQFLGPPHHRSRRPVKRKNDAGHVSPFSLSPYFSLLPVPSPFTLIWAWVSYWDLLIFGYFFRHATPMGGLEVCLCVFGSI